MRLLGQDARVTGPLRRETVLQVGNETAGAAPPTQPLSLPRSGSVAPSQYRAPEFAPGAPVAPSTPGDGGWGRRLRRESVDAWGISTAIFLGSVGAAAGYVASSALDAAVVTGAAAFVVVYLVRLLVATALGDPSDRR
jgi:hypothetical protein